ncbi:hypothetical protein EV639_10182 [Rathayibacter tanaceti]|uniref:Uncharacterized protein n=2 Tax=Rathayibacter tanaceti TaxID=1671680 RepID=A0ACD2XMP5_9MICO|nr:hypothetical protein ACH61_00864 [Rathayibacter tanaceti]TCO39140.1 hypothetical protein EV639_10182 [Rathayibacter tanaceti]
MAERGSGTRRSSQAPERSLSADYTGAVPEETTFPQRARNEGATEAETIEELRDRLDSLLNDPLDQWAANMHFGGVHYVADFESTLSWKVTRPLRAARTFQIRVGQLGLPGAVRHSIRYAKRRFGGRAR